MHAKDALVCAAPRSLTVSLKKVYVSKKIRPKSRVKSQKTKTSETEKKFVDDGSVEMDLRGIATKATSRQMLNGRSFRYHGGRMNCIGLANDI